MKDAKWGGEALRRFLIYRQTPFPEEVLRKGGGKGGARLHVLAAPLLTSGDRAELVAPPCGKAVNSTVAGASSGGKQSHVL